MKHQFLSLSTAVLFGLTTANVHAEIIYSETFPGNGNGAASAAGWDLSSAQNDAILFGTLYGGFNPGDTSTGSVAYLTNATSDDGSSGDAFTELVQADYDSIDFSFKYTNDEFNAIGVQAIRLAVEVGGQLYASTTIATPTGSGPASTYSLTFDPLATGWLTVTPGISEVAIGSAATSALTGNITAVGIVQTNSSGAITSFDDFEINVERAAAVPEPSAMAALAILGPGLLMWRRRQQNASARQ